MMNGYDKPLYVLPFDHRGSFETGMFGWTGALTPGQSSQISAAKQVIYNGFQQAIEDGVPKEKVGILVDEEFGADILRDAAPKRMAKTVVPRVETWRQRSVLCSWE
jgi:myo-inositol catabolism protein IolC